MTTGRRGEAGPSPTRADVFAADADVGGDLAEVNWAATPLGAPQEWPLSLQTAVRIVLRSRFPMWMAWGPELTFFCNAAYRHDTLGSKYPWALGRPARDVWEEIWDDIGPRIEGVLSSGEATWDEGLLLFLRRSGFVEETYHTFSYSPLSDDDGRIVGMLCVVSEDTDRVVGERRMATLRDLGSDPRLLPSEDQTLRYASARLGRNPYDLPFTLLYRFDADGSAQLSASTGVPTGHPAAPVRLDPGVDVVWPMQRVLDGHLTVATLNGEAFIDVPSGPWPTAPSQALVVPLLQQGVAPFGFLVAGINPHRPLDDGYRGFVTLIASHVAAEVGSSRNYVAQQRRAAALADLDRAKTVFFSNVSHEFRTPLTLMLGPVTELLSTDDGTLDDRTREDLEVVHRNGLRLTKLVNTLLDFSRIEANRMQASYAPVDVAAVTAELASGFRSAIDRAGLTLVVDCPPLDEPLYLDRDMWEKVVLNLLSNAVKFTARGSITVRVRRADADAVVVTIADTGIGVPAAEMARLFERFHRIPAVWARSHEGSGIGLALVKELVGLHGGTIAADSVEGAGTTFAIRIPFGTAHLAPEALATVPPRLARAAVTASRVDPYVQEALRWLPSGGPDPPSTAGVDRATDQTVVPAGVLARVLVADDNADMRAYVTRLLTEAGYDVEEAADGRHALDLIWAKPPDLVVSDVMMPHLDGLGLVAALRGDPRTSAMPVVLLSARAGQEASVDGLHAGADDYLVKPFAATELLARVHANLTLARLRGHHERWHAALIDSLQEAFFVCDERGTVIEINTAFADVLGFRPEGLPYPAPHPWWPDPVTDLDAHQQVADAFDGLLTDDHGSYTVPVTHHDGHRLWVTVTFTHAADPDTGHRVTVGTLRDVTAEHYRVRRQTALAGLSHVLAQAESVDQAVESTAGELRQLWRARRVLAIEFPSHGTAAAAPRVVCAGEPRSGWEDLSAATRTSIEHLREAGLLDPTTDTPGSAAIALPHPDGVLVVYVELAEHRPFTAPDQTLLTVLAGHLSQGLHRVHQVDQQHQTAVALQHAILGPALLPASFAVRYQPATQPLQVGGDWYDVIDLDDGRIGLIVGDCVGHGLAAAAVMGQLRSACRALLLENPSPAAALAGLDSFAARLPGARCTTVLCAVLDTDTGQFVYSSAGHPPPVLLDPVSGIRTFDEGRAIPVGIYPGRPRPEATTILPGRATLLLYTDGLVERRRQSLDDGIARAGELLRAAAEVNDLDTLADHLVTTLAPQDGYPDDVAVLLYRHPAPLQMSFPADASQLAAARTALRSWLRRTDMAVDQIQDVLVAVGEAVANAIEHGHRDRPAGTVTLAGHAIGANLHVRVADTGTWKPSALVPNITRGRGITLMRALLHDVTIRSDHTGTTVDLYSRIT